MLITPETKVGALLDAHPQLEGPLIELVPAFEKLKNPLLRRTVAKVATLEHAARVGGIELPTLLAHLRRHLGQEAACGSQAPVEHRSAKAPDWMGPGEVAVTLDAERILAEGAHPLSRVKAALSANPQGIVALTSTFEPAPLLELLSNDGVKVWCSPTRAGYVAYFRRG